MDPAAPMSVLGAIEALDSIGVLPVIVVVATLGLAVWIYKKFRK